MIFSYPPLVSHPPLQVIIVQSLIPKYTSATRMQATRRSTPPVFWLAGKVMIYQIHPVNKGWTIRKVIAGGGVGERSTKKIHARQGGKETTPIFVTWWSTENWRHIRLEKSLAARSASCKMDAWVFMVSSFLWPTLTRNCLSWIPEMLQSYWIIYFSRYIGKTEMFSTVLMAFSRQLRVMSWRVCRNSVQNRCWSNFCFSWLLIQCNRHFK